MKKLRIVYLRPHPFSTQTRDERLDTVELDFDGAGEPSLELLEVGVRGATGDEVIRIDSVVELLPVTVEITFDRQRTYWLPRPLVEDAKALRAEIAHRTTAPSGRSMLVRVVEEVA